MSNAKQILAMLRSRAEGDEDMFLSIALQVAASEARQGRKSTAEELREAVNKSRALRSQGAKVPISFNAPRGELEDLIELKEPRFNLNHVILSDEIKDRMTDSIRQQSKRSWLREYGKIPNRNLLFVGPPGAGKTMSAEALAGELRLPFFVIRLEAVITRFMGDTAAKLRLVFDETAKRRGVYLFDEFDAIGSNRSSTNDVAEMRRVLNSFLQFMEENNTTDSVIICSTNHPSLLDQALLRRYDQVIEFQPPTPDQIKLLIRKNITPLKTERLAWTEIIKVASGLSQSEIVRAIDDAVKTAILDERNKLSKSDIVTRLTERQEMRASFSKSDFS